MLGSPVYLKCENLQRTGSYKIRGAYNRLSKLSETERARGVVAASAGNHAQGVAFAARELGITATIFMPLGVALPKLQATRDYGAEVVLEGRIFDETLRAAAAFAERTGAVFIPPFDHIDVVEGQGTLGLEISEQMPEVDTVDRADRRRRPDLRGGERHEAESGDGRQNDPGDRRAGRQRRRLSGVARERDAHHGRGDRHDRRRHRRGTSGCTELRDHPRRRR